MSEWLSIEGRGDSPVKQSVHKTHILRSEVSGDLLRTKRKNTLRIINYSTGSRTGIPFQPGDGRDVQVFSTDQVSQKF